MGERMAQAEKAANDLKQRMEEIDDWIRVQNKLIKTDLASLVARVSPESFVPPHSQAGQRGHPGIRAGVASTARGPQG